MFFKNEHQLKLLENRLKVILDGRKIKIAPETVARISGQDLVTANVLVLIKSLFQEDQSVELNVCDLIVVTLARYPLEGELTSLVFLYEQESLDKFIEIYLFKHKNEILSSLTTGSSIELADASKIYYDVSGTIDLPFMSGIQRVVRHLAIEAEKNQLEFQPFVFSEPFFSRAIRGHEIKKLTNFEEKVFDPKFSEHGHLGITRKKFIKQTLNAFKIAVVQFLHAAPGGKRVLKCLVAFKKKLQGPRKPEVVLRSSFLYLKNTKILQPECALEDHRVSFYVANIPILNSPLTMILYDFIPIVYPETCAVISGPFANYLRILRVASGVCAISKSVLEDYFAYSKLLGLDNTKIKADFLWLGSDFISGTNEDVVETKGFGAEPLMLVVGTIEPRKNHLNIARAALRLHRKGYKFRLVFAGRLGWKQENAVQEFNWMKSQGLRLDILNGLSDKEIEVLYRGCAFTLFCSYAEGFGLPIIESLSYGKPCITSNLGSMKELAQELGGCKLIEPIKIASIEEAMIEFLTSPKSAIAAMKPISFHKLLSWNDYARGIQDLVLSIK